VSSIQGIEYVATFFKEILYTGCPRRNVPNFGRIPYVKVYRYKPKHVYPNLKVYRNNGQRSLKL
jgi:hypothetical protein